MDEEPMALLARSWEANAAAWTRAVREDRIESRRLATDAAVLDAVLRRAPKRALDVGCGEGWLCRALSRHGVEAVGVDGSVPLIKAARRLGEGRFIAASFREVAGDPTRLGSEAFDVAICNFALLEQEVSPLLRALRSRLQPDGAVVIQTLHPWGGDDAAPYADGWRTEDFAALGGGFAEPMPWYFRTFASWVEQLASAGLVIASAEEPVHPESGRPLSLLLVAIPSDLKAL